LRFLIVDHYYQGVLARFEARNPGWAQQGYAELQKSLSEELFGETQYEVAALRALGHEADDLIVNAAPLRRTWAGEHGVALPPASRLKPVLRRHVVPWLSRESSTEWMWVALLAQVRSYRPEVVHIQCVDLLPPDVVRAIRDEVRLVVGQLAAPLPPWPISGYGLMVSSLPNLVDRFRGLGLDAEWLPLAFEPSLRQRIRTEGRDIGLSFVGSLSPHHARRAMLLREVASRTELDIWTTDGGRPEVLDLKASIHPAVWGRGMYEVLGRSRATINTHIDVADGFANNLRLYEATGMGALLITDAKQNLGQLFEVGREVVAYRDAAECVELVDHYLGRPAEAAQIAGAGQRRTLRDHTWSDRMARLSEFVRART
jgi:spore maturation protein CgeB